MSLSAVLRNYLAVALGNKSAATELADAVDVTSSATPGTGAASKALVLDSSGNVTMPDLGKISYGGVFDVSWDTTDANANMGKLQFPAGGSTDVPVLMIGQSIEGVDQVLYDGAVDPYFVFLGVGARATGPGIDFRKCRGTATSPTVVTSGDDLGTIRGYAAVAAGEWIQSTEILLECSGTVATTRAPGKITLKTATDAAPSVITTAMVIAADQIVVASVGFTSTGNATFSNTITGSNGVGSAGQQLQSAGTATQVLWGAAGSLSLYKDVQQERKDQQDVLKRFRDVPVYDFKYKPRRPDMEIISTGDEETTYTGILAEEMPEVMHHEGRILNPINTFGYTALAIKALIEKLDAQEKEIAALKAAKVA